MAADPFWNAGRITKLAQLAAAGHSASIIGARLGVSRCGVIGKARREGIRLSGKRAGGRPKRLPIKDRPPPSKPKNPRVPQAPKVAPRREELPPPMPKPRGNWATVGKKGGIKIACMWIGCGGAVGVDPKTREAEPYCATCMPKARAAGMVRRFG